VTGCSLWTCLRDYDVFVSDGITATKTPKIDCGTPFLRQGNTSNGGWSSELEEKLFERSPKGHLLCWMPGFGPSNLLSNHTPVNQFQPGGKNPMKIESCMHNLETSLDISSWIRRLS
jgi:hypothetical protein